MALSVACSNCGKTFRAADEHAGKRTKCPNCANPIVVPLKPAASHQEPPPAPTRPHPPAPPRTERVTHTNAAPPEPPPAPSVAPPEPPPAPNVAPRFAPAKPSKPSATNASAEQTGSHAAHLEVSNPYAAPSFTTAEQRTFYVANGALSQQPDAPGVISLIFGVVGLVILVFGCLLGCIGGFFLYPVALLLSVVGLGLGMGAKGNLRVAGITLNALVLLPAVIMLIMMVLIGISGAATDAANGFP